MGMLYQATAMAMGKSVDEVKLLLASGDSTALATVAMVLPQIATDGTLTNLGTQFAAGLAGVVSYIHGINSEVKIIVCTQYQPYQWLTMLDAINPAMDACVQQLNALIQGGTGYEVADVYTAFKASSSSLTNAGIGITGLNLDFHPNQAGHQVIATLLAPMFPAMTTYPAPEDVTINGLTASVSFSPEGPVSAEEAVTVTATLTLKGTAEKAYTHKLNLKAEGITLGNEEISLAVTAKEAVEKSYTYTFTTPTTGTSSKLNFELIHTTDAAPVPTAAPVTELINKETGIKLQGVGETAVDAGSKLIVIPMQDTTAYDALLQKIIPGGKIMGSYSINLMLGNTVVQPKGKFKLMFPLNEEMKALGQLQVVSVALNGTISLIEAKPEDGYMVLTTD